MPLFSIIAPTYNCGSKIERTINSFARQRPDLFELIIVDGGSTDETLKTINACRGAYQLISERDQGVYDAMNKGIRAATGKYLNFLGAGDTLRPHALENIRRAMPNETRSFVYGSVYWVDQAMIYDGEFTPEKLRTRNICHQAIFYERTIFETLGGFDLKYNVLADYAFNIRCFGDNRIKRKYLSYVITNYEGGGLSSHQRDLNLLSDHAELIKGGRRKEEGGRRKCGQSRTALSSGF